MLMIIALMFISLAALLHVYIFYLEVFAWEKPAARKVFGEASVEELAITRFFAYTKVCITSCWQSLPALGWQCAIPP